MGFSKLIYISMSDIGLYTCRSVVIRSENALVCPLMFVCEYECEAVYVLRV